MSPRADCRAIFSAWSVSSRACDRTSRIRSRPAKASVICVPILLIWINGATNRPVKTMNMKISPTVMVPARTARVPAMAMARPINPKRSDARLLTVDTPTMERTMLRSKRCAP